jgi:hypothetical protein
MAEILGPMTLSGNCQAGYTVVPQNYVSYSWSVGDGGTIVYGETGPVVIIQWTGLGQIQLTVNMYDTQQTPDSVTVTVDISTQDEPPRRNHDR